MPLNANEQGIMCENKDLDFMGNGVEELWGNSVSWNEHFEVKTIIKTKTESRPSKKKKRWNWKRSLERQ